MKGNSGDWLGILGFAGVLALIIAGRRVFPVLSTILLVCAALLVLVIVAIVVLALTLCRGTKKDPRQQSFSEILSQARGDILRVRLITLRIRHKEIQARSAEIVEEADKILRILKERPDSVPAARRFWNYYLPTAGKILEKFAYLEGNGQAGEEMAQTTAACLSEIRTVLSQQREKLFGGDILDLTAEMEVLRQMCRRDGLLTEAELPAEPEAELTDGYTDDLEDEQGNTRGM